MLKRRPIYILYNFTFAKITLKNFISMRYLGIIPARYASTRFPGKPVAIIAGKPMVQWVYERAGKLFDDLYVATDDARIANVVKSFGGKYVLTLDKHRSGTDRCAEALETIEKNTAEHFDVVVNIQGDEPFIQTDQLSLLVESFQHKDIEIATLVKQIDSREDVFNPSKPKVVVSETGKALYFSRSPIPYLRDEDQSIWVAKHKYYKHIGLYAYRSDVLKEICQLSQSPLELAESLEQLRWLENGYHIHASETDVESISVDTPEDLKKAEEWASRSL